MINKICTAVADALSGIKSGDTILIGGFGAVGQASQLIEGLIPLDVEELTVVANNAGFGDQGLAKLLTTGKVRRLVCSFPRVAGSTAFETLYKAGKIELELVPQGTLAERLRAAGAGIPAFFTRAGAGTILAEGKETRVIDGVEYVLESALQGDIALVEAWQADRWGNLTYRKSGRNFNPVMATAAKVTIAQVQHLMDLGQIDPENVVTPSVYVDRVVHVPYLNGA